MAFQQMAEVSFIEQYVDQIEVQANDQRISLIPSCIKDGYKLSAQVIPRTLDNTASFTVTMGVSLTITFDEMDQKMHFINTLGDLTE